MIREDWVENGEQRALIIRPDVGESYLLFPDRGEYVVEKVEGDGRSASASATAQIQAENETGGSKQPDSRLFVDPIAIERDLSPPATTSNTNLTLPDAKVDGHSCRVSERRAIISDGTTEITRTYKASDLAGLPIRIESESEGKNGRVRVVTENRDIQLDVPPTLFDIPGGFKRRAASHAVP
jgi:hypothetical protein